MLALLEALIDLNIFFKVIASSTKTHKCRLAKKKLPDVTFEDLHLRYTLSVVTSK